jgi:hypothetical protein
MRAKRRLLAPKTPYPYTLTAPAAQPARIILMGAMRQKREGIVMIVLDADKA